MPRSAYPTALDAAPQDGRWLDDPKVQAKVLTFLLSKLSPADLAELEKIERGRILTSVRHLGIVAGREVVEAGEAVAKEGERPHTSTRTSWSLTITSWISSSLACLSGDLVHTM